MQSPTAAAPYAARLTSLVSIPLQEGQRKMNCSGRIPSFAIVRTRFMVSPQQTHTMVGGVPAGYGGERSMADIDRWSYGISAAPLNQAGALSDSQSPTPGAPLSMIITCKADYDRCESSLGQKAIFCDRAGTFVNAVIGSPGRIRTSDQPVNSGFKGEALQSTANRCTSQVCLFSR